jgi:hypothetical protein
MPRVYAQQISPGEIPDIMLEGQPSQMTANISNWVDLLIVAVQWFYTIVFVFAVLFILLSAFNFITSSGNPEKVKKAKDQAKYAIIGVVVALLARAAVPFVQNVLNGG